MKEYVLFISELTALDVVSQIVFFFFSLSLFKKGELNI